MSESKQDKDDSKAGCAAMVVAAACVLLGLAVVWALCHCPESSKRSMYGLVESIEKHVRESSLRGDSNCQNCCHSEQRDNQNAQP